MGSQIKMKSFAAKASNLILGCAVFGISSFFIVWGIGQMWLKAHSRTWPHVTGTILKSELSVRRTKGTSFWPSVLYEYEVGGRKYTSSMIMFGQPGSGREDEARAAVKFYSVGKRVPVYYNPTFYHWACLQPG